MSAVLTNVYDIWLSHHFIDSVHQLGKSHSLFGSSCGRRSSSSQQDRDELTRNLDIPPSMFVQTFSPGYHNLNIKILASDINFRLG